MKTQVNMTITNTIYEKFKEICDAGGKKYNHQIEKMMKDFIKEHTK